MSSDGGHDGPHSDDDDVILAPVEGAEDDELFSDEDSDDLDEGQMIKDIGQHQLMGRVQARLNQRIRDKDERISMELREKQEEKKRQLQKREQIGVELYNAQQQLAKLQMLVEQHHGDLQDVNGERLDADETLVKMRDAYQGERQDVAEARKDLEKNQAEHDAQNATLLQVANYDKEMQGEIAVIRRATYKAEADVKDLEKEKEQQDLYIDRQNEEVKRLHEKLALATAQLESQRRETGAAQQTLAEATKEMEGLEFEKRQLMAQWQSALLGMQRRDEALTATHDAIHKQEEAEMALDAEIAGFKKSIQEQQLRNEQLAGLVSQLDGEAQRLEDEIARAEAKRERLAERYALLRKSLEQTDAEHARGATELKNVRDKILVLDQHWQTVERERRALEDQVLETQGTQTTVTKAVANLGKEARKVMEKVKEKEMERENMLNELSRIRVDVLNTETHNGQLEESLETLVQELKEKERLVEKYDLEMRQRNDEVEKKMHTVDKLNRRYEALTADKEDVNTGPLEATIKNLTKQIAKRREETQEMQQLWLRKQTELVSVSQTGDRVGKDVQELKSERTVLSQKKIRVDGAISATRTEVENLRKAVEAMHHDMGRMNKLIADNRDLQERLENANYNLEKGFVEELKELQMESAGLEGQVASVKREKDDMLESILEAEKQIMLWEKKMLLEKETQSALDPEVGQAEARAMEKEIHRMRLRYDTLKRDQERLIHEMERAIEKSEAIELRQRGKKALDEARGKQGAEMTRQAVKKKVAALKATLKKTKGEVDSYAAAVAQKEAEMNELSVHLDEASGTYSRKEDEANALQRSINDALYEKQRAMDKLAKLRRDIRRYEETLKRGPSAPPRPAESMKVEEELASAEAEREAVRTVITGLGGRFDKLSEVLDRVQKLTEI